MSMPNDDKPVATYAFTIPGEPVAWCRAAGTKIRHTPQKLREWKKKVQQYALTDKPATPHTGPIRLLVIAHYALPKSTPQWKQPLMRGGDKCTLPDVDNLAKGVMDALQGMHFENDGQVSRLMTGKGYAPGGEEPELKVRVDAFAPYPETQEEYIGDSS